jgi:hypothetical protein
VIDKGSGEERRKMEIAKSNKKLRKKEIEKKTKKRGVKRKRFLLTGCNVS